MNRRRFYVGLQSGGGRKVFSATTTPTVEDWGTQYLAVIGPFVTKRGATFMAVHGRNNPHLQTVADAERIAKESQK